jgi:hypothetical protein
MLIRRRDAPKISLSPASRLRLHRRRVALAVLRQEEPVNRICDAGLRLDDVLGLVRQRRREVEDALLRHRRRAVTAEPVAPRSAG